MRLIVLDAGYLAGKFGKITPKMPPFCDFIDSPTIPCSTPPFTSYNNLLWFLANHDRRLGL